MLREKVVFNLVGKKGLVDKAALEIKDIIYKSTNEPVSIIMENKDTILNKITTKYTKWALFLDKIGWSNNSWNRWNINKCYISDECDDIVEANKIVDLSRHIRNTSHSTIHPYNLHIENVEERYVSDFMKKCSQINSVYPMNSPEHIKKQHIDVYLNS